MSQFELTPKALANFSPGFERSENPGVVSYRVVTLQGFANRRTLSGLNVILIHYPGLSLRSNHWAEN
jgi:hypothetical protein